MQSWNWGRRLVRRQRSESARRLAGFIVILWFSVALPANAQVNMAAYRDYFLVGQFGEVCTMCEVTVLCAAGATPPDSTGALDTSSFTLYHLQTRTFWSQIATIWEWFVANFSSEPLAARGHTRPVHIYTVNDRQWSPLQVVEARLVLNPGVIEFGTTRIDRLNRQWIDTATGQPRGYCVRLPLWDTLAVIERHTSSEAAR